MRKLVVLILANLAIFSVVLVLTEVSGQAAYYLIHGRLLVHDAPGRLHQQIFELHPYLAGRLRTNAEVENRGKTITTTEVNTRWTGAPEDDGDRVRVAVLGGSATFGTGVTDSDSWPALLQAQLGPRFSVTNYGVPGYSTAEAVIQMALIVPESKPHFVVQYQGWNDIRNYHEPELGVDYYGHGVRQYKNLSIPFFSRETAFEKIHAVSATARLANRIRTFVSPTPSAEAHETFVTPDPFVDDLYVRNLQTLKTLGDALGASSLFVPQVLNYALYRKQDGAHKWSRRIDNSAMPRLMDRFNELMRSVCVDEDPDCIVVDDVLTQEWKGEDFLDHGHFSRAGGEKFAATIAGVIVRRAADRGTP